MIVEADTLVLGLRGWNIYLSFLNDASFNINASRQIELGQTGF